MDQQIAKQLKSVEKKEYCKERICRKCNAELNGRRHTLDRGNCWHSVHHYCKSCIEKIASGNETCSKKIMYNHVMVNHNHCMECRGIKSYCAQKRKLEIKKEETRIRKCTCLTLLEICAKCIAKHVFSCPEELLQLTQANLPNSAWEILLKHIPAYAFRKEKTDFAISQKENGKAMFQVLGVIFGLFNPRSIPESHKVDCDKMDISLTTTTTTTTKFEMHNVNNNNNNNN